MDNKPRARQKRVGEGGKGVTLHGPTGMGQVGSGSAMGGGAYGGGKRDGGGGGGKMGMIIALIVLLLGGGGAGMSSFLGGGDASSYEEQAQSTAGQQSQTAQPQTASQQTGAASSETSYAGSSLAGLFGNVSSTSAGWTDKANTGVLDTSVDPSARNRYTTIRGNGDDIVTIMVYMCGTDLESRSGMATNDLTEMSKATLSDNVNLIVYTGGCKGWKNNVISSRTNQIYQIKNGGLKCLENDLGSKAMTDPATLTSFIKYCSSNYPADRNMLIFWDHGGGSISGYGYDEKFAGSGSMSLAGINTALKNAGIKYDFIGFDACLMATVETDLMAAEYADYMIASEETEPGVGWYYTNWLTALSKNTSMPTIEIGKNIVDDFVDVCARSCYGQKTTLSVVDLAELSATVGDDFKSFSQDTTQLIKDGEYKVVSDARSNVREFATSSRIDQIDLVNFAQNLGTDKGKALSDTLLSSVKYNRTSSNMTDAYGISIYFPYRKTSSVSKAVSTYDQIGIDSEYSS
ncbi:MAG: peptidase C11, partial [Lachnospiraceae bacterium]|nr:peptidase C11 [Lachnospiraceae bacterium]